MRVTAPRLHRHMRNRLHASRIAKSPERVPGKLSFQRTVELEQVLIRVREAHRYYWRSDTPAEEWLLIEWPHGELEPTKYRLSNLDAQISPRDLVYTAKLRRRIERDYQELKQEIGLGHFEGGGWRGFHHHATLCIAAYAFLVAERGSSPPLSARLPTILHGASSSRRLETKGFSHRDRSDIVRFLWPQ